MFTSPSHRAKGKGAPGYRRDVAYAGIRELLGGLSPAQVQSMTPTTDKVYKLVAKAKGDTPNSVDLGDGAQGHWIGASQANHIMLYFHGMSLHLVSVGLAVWLRFADAECRRWILWFCDRGPHTIYVYSAKEHDEAGP